MNKALGHFVRGALVAGIILLVTTSSGWAAIAGKVVNDVGTAVPGARVEVWSSYPGGAILDFGSTNGAGEFSLPSGAPGFFDLRVYKPSAGKPEFFPSVIRHMPKPVTNAMAILFPVGKILPSSEFRSYWDTSSTFLGRKLNSGDVLEAFDPTGVLCGIAASAGNGSFMMYVVGDDGLPDGIHEGPFAGESVNFRINGLAAQTPVVWYPLGDQNHHLTGASFSHGVTVTGPTDATGQQGSPALISFQFTNTGTVTDTFEVSASIPNGWPVTYPAAKVANVILAAGASATTDVLVHIPPGTPDQTVIVSFEARSLGQSTIAAGATTALSVTTPTDVGSGGDGSTMPSQFSLAQNYPNPFNPETEIAFNLRVEGLVRLEVFNLLGQSVAVLVDGVRPQGANTVHWDGHDSHGTTVPTGIYFYRLTQNNQSLVRKMTLLK